MAVKFGVWRVDGPTPQPVPPVPIDSEDRLEKIIENAIDILGLGNLLLIGRQVVTDFNKRIDLLAIDDQGNLTVIELKKGMTPREVVAQTLEYGFWVRDLSFEAIRTLFAKYNGGAEFESAFTQHFEVDVPETLNEEHHLVIVASGLDASTEQIVDYVRSYGVPINVLFFQYLLDSERGYLARSWLSDPTLEPTPSGGTGKKQAAWNGVDFYVAVGESIHRSWDDMRRYGFVSAGHGEKYRRAMSNLFVGARVWASVTGSGYVGVGTVIAESLPVTDFVVDLDGVSSPILDAPLQAENMGEDCTDPSLVEYLVRVEWSETRARSEALWAKGMFANQNVVAKLRQPFTLSRLAEEFEIDGN